MNAMPDYKDAAILIVDDQEVNVMLLEKMLQMEGYTRIHTATDSRAVADLYREKRFDLILLDLNMPYLDGFQVMEQLRAIEAGNYLPILVLTAQADMPTRLRALESGAKDFLVKPFDRLEVLTRIRNMLEVRLLHQQVRDQNRLLEEKVRERTRELLETRQEIIRRLGMAAEYRDNETGLHIVRMSRICALLGRAVGLAEAQCDLLLSASPMHDVGKIGIPDAILLKPGKLDGEEWEVMKTHAEIGAELLSGHPSDLMEMARIIALSHHEKWDGSGYPAGLKGEDIPLPGRIAALADVFDALTSDRPYKKAWSVEAALAYIDESSGKHFDPALVAAFRSVLPEVAAIRVRYADRSEQG
ncbi:MAG: HD-GYP domain-containing protein [Burkholderiales bacterium]